MGSGGAGTIFFTHCNLRCVFCQNYQISRGECGEVITVGQLADEMLKLQLPPSIDDRQRFFWRDRNELIGHAGSDQGV